MSGAEAILGIVAGGAGLLSLAIQLAENAKKLKRFYDGIKNAPETLRTLADDLETMSLFLQQLECHRQADSQDVALLVRCLERCQRSSDNIKETVEKMERYMVRFKLGNLYTAFKEREIKDLLGVLEQAKSSLHLAFSIYHAAQQAQHARAQEARLATIQYGNADISQQLALLRLEAAIRQQGLLSQGTAVPLTHQRVAISTGHSGPIESLLGGKLPAQYARSGSVTQGKKKTRIQRIRISLYWTRLSSRVWDMAVMDAGFGLDLRIRTYNIVSRGSEIFDCCKKGDIVRMQALVADGKASFLDCDPLGCTLLWVSKCNIAG
ncbi:hypothetical protein LTR36_009276 [Oleoguttula mirabilis]|uniref:Azaphilone pigments biosynthesis cluster protein L N-terminal domain-containing protein n=1 Tax=Oleoguttula mirabilis TaxID=1507867 RepID=A0AAV9J5Z9_9PEZI|nr:hypothetical protein LTR36_009276 [Oleoguttula mirabilis]